MKEEEVERLIHERAWRFGKGKNMDDLISQSRLLYMIAVRSYKKGKGTTLFSWAYRIITQGLIRYLHRTDDPVEDFPDERASTRGEFRPDLCVEFRDRLLSMSQEAKHVCWIILNGPAELLKLKGSEPPKTIRGKLVRHLKKKGWKSKSIFETFDEIKTTLRD